MWLRCGFYEPIIVERGRVDLMNLNQSETISLSERSSVSFSARSSISF